MAAGDASGKVTLSMVIRGEYNTICRDLDVKEVVEALTKEDSKLPKKLQKRVKKIGKTNDANLFYSVLNANFELDEFLIFLDVLKVSKNEKHTLLYSKLCEGLENLSLKHETNPEVAEKVKFLVSSVKVKKDGVETRISEKTELATEQWEKTDLATEQWKKIEAVTFTRTNGAILYSDTHGITVSVPPEAFPENVDSLIVSGSVNSSSQPITLPDHCKGVYTPLVSLTCEPRIHAFMDFVTVTIPHCAVGNFADNLCIVTAADDMFELTEDPTIEIESIDQHYITFRTKHFSKLLGSSSRKRKQRRRKKRGPHLPPSKSLDEPTAQNPVSFTRSFSSPPAVERDLDARCYAAMCTSPQQSKLILFLVTLNLPTHSKELEEFASKNLKSTVASLNIDTAPFTFSQDYIHFKPESTGENGWRIQAKVNPPIVDRESVKVYQTSQYIPAVKYDVFADDNPQNANFKITLEGSLSKSSVPISFNIILCKRGLPALPAPYTKCETINIISNLYDQSSPVIRALNQNMDTAEVLLNNDNRDCQTLFCEISFHLPRWQEVACIVGMAKSDIDEIQQYQIISSYEAAYKMLETWVRKSLDPPKLGTLIAALSRVGIRLEVSLWKTNYHNIIQPTIELTQEKIAEIGSKVQLHWQILARLLGESWTDIGSIEVDHSHESGRERACKMFVNWQKHCPQGSSRLVDAIRCIHQHTHHHHDLVWEHSNSQ